MGDSMEETVNKFFYDLGVFIPSAFAADVLENLGEIMIVGN